MVALRFPIPASASRRKSRRYIRGLSASRREHEPPLRGHWPWPGDQPRACLICLAAKSSYAVSPASGALSSSICRSKPLDRRRRSRLGRYLKARPRGFAAAVELAVERLPDDRANFQPQRMTLLIVEDDLRYNLIICDLAKRAGFKVLAAMRGSDGLRPCSGTPTHRIAWSFSTRHARLDRAEPAQADPRPGISRPGCYPR